MSRYTVNRYTPYNNNNHDHIKRILKCVLPCMCVYVCPNKCTGIN